MTYIINSKLRTFKRACILCTALVSLGLGNAHAQQNSDLSRSDLMGLAKEFVTRIGSGLDQAEGRSQEILNPALADANRIPNGEELILQLVAGPKKIALNFDIIAIKQSYGMDVLLEDFFGAVDFPIFVDQDDGTAEGWYIRENQIFALDMPNGKVVINGTEYPIENGEAFELDGDIYAQSTALEKWFNLKFLYNYEELRVQILSEQPLPAEERAARQKKNAGIYTSRNDPTLPYEELEYSALGIPFFDVNLRGSYFKREDSDARKRASYSVIGAGDVAYLTGRAYVSGDDDTPISTVRLSFEKDSLEPDLLGPLKAKYFSFGDIDPTRLEISSNSPQEQGVRVTNADKDSSNGLNTTFFRGDAQPGWDVELYRDDRLLANQTIEDNGQYEFLDIPLFAGENNFRIVLYGPQGEIRERVESVPVNSDTFANQGTTYDVSLTRANEVTYEAEDFERPQDGTPVLNARFNRSLGKNISGFAGLSTRDEGDQRRYYLESGLNTYVADTFLDLNLGYEASESEFGAEAIARRNFGAHSARASLFAATDGFQPAPLDEINPTVLRANLNLNGPAKGFFDYNANYAANARYQEFASGNSATDLDATYSTRLRNLILNNSLSYRNLDNLNGTSDDTLLYTTNLRGYYKGGFYRLASNYNITPDSRLQSLFASYNYPFTRDISGLAEVEHFVDPSRTELTGTMNWKTDQATISPRFSIDTDKTIQAALNVRFGVGYNPTTNDVDLFNQRLTNTGGVSASIFLDANGNGIYDENEELIEGAQLNAVQASRKAFSDSKGVAFIPDLPQGRITDIKIDRETLYDPFYISSNPGISLRPRPGVVKELQFPIVVAGEMDGNVNFIEDEEQKTPARQFKMSLIAPWGEVIQSTYTAYDGFYVFTDIPPGIYYLVTDYKIAKRANYQMPSPELLVFKPDGTTVYDQNFDLVEGTPISYSFDSDIEPQSRKNPKVLQKIGKTSASMRIGPFASRIAAGVNMLKLKRAKTYIRQSIEVLDPLESLSRDPDDKKFWIRAETARNSIEDVEQACRSLAQFEIPCQVNIYTHAYKPAETALNDENAQPEKG